MNATPDNTLADPEQRIADLERQLAEAREQQAATAEVLVVINSSSGDLAPVFNVILENAIRLCGGLYGVFWTLEGERALVASRDMSPKVVELLRQQGESGNHPLLRRVIGGDHLFQFDLAEHDAHRLGQVTAALSSVVHGVRQVIWLAMVKEGTAVGAFVIARSEPRPFTEEQIALLQNFAAQAVIAMENARLLTETREALEQQTATAEVLGVINSSPGDLAPVFDAMLEKAMSLCEASFGALFIREGERSRAVATRGLPASLNDFVRQGFVSSPPNRNPIFRGEAIAHVLDLTKEPLADQPGRTAAVELGGARTMLGVALRKDGILLGTFSVFRQEVRPFSDKQIALLQNFAAQAVIAMENARLIRETREALEQQTATAEVLQVINSSPGDLEPVFDALLDKALRLCEASYGMLLSWDGERLHRSAFRGASVELLEALGGSEPVLPPPGSVADQLLRGEDVIYTADITQDPSFAHSPRVQILGRVGGFRSLLNVALRKENAFFGVLAIYRKEKRPFDNKEIALLQNFAAQAVIAMENARLLTETREALEQQTATAEVLQVINASPGDLAPVFDAMLSKATHLCEASFGSMQTYDGERFEWVASHRVPVAFTEWRERNPVVFGPGTAPARVASGEELIHTADLMASEAYQRGDPSRRALVDLGGARSHLIVALRKDSALLGTIAVYRQEVRPFSDKQIALLQNFAAQAVIAMENARLLTETQEALERQTATAEVLQVINSSPGNLAPVFDAILDKAHALCGATLGSLQTYDGELFRTVAASRGLPDTFLELLREPFRPGPNSFEERLVLGEEVVHIPDVKALGPLPDDPLSRAAVETAGLRTLLLLPLRREAALVGYVASGRGEVWPFSDKEIALLQNFAAQAVIAMENARLLGELRQRTDQVAELNRGLEARVAEQVEELGRVGRLRRFLAPQLAELIVSQGNEQILESHRREIVVVFCDLRGYTAFTETAEPEEVLDFLRDYHGALGPLVAQFEGTLDQFSGDGIMVFFNDPVPIPDPAARAVKMAVAMRETASTLISNWRRLGRDLGFGAGIAQGYATLGQIGFSERSGYTAIGTVCNVAARLCAQAKDGQILISQRVAARLDENIAIEDIGALTLKGLMQPVVAYNVPLAATQPALRVIEGGPQSH